jgi:hypothetical protein
MAALRVLELNMGYSFAFQLRFDDAGSPKSPLEIASDPAVT